jgi:hypothetical protein
LDSFSEKPKKKRKKEDVPQYRWILRIFLIAAFAFRRPEPLSETTL